MKKTLLSLLLLIPAAAQAQTTYDNGPSYGARATVEADVKLAKGLHLLSHEEYRYYSNSDDIMRFYTGAGLEYKVLPFLKVGAEYEWIKRIKYDDDALSHVWSTRHRGSLFATGTFRTGAWQFGLKETLRLTHRPDDVNTWQSPRNALALKSKVSVKYRGLGKVVPFGAVELRNALNNASYSGTYNAAAEKDKDRYTDEEFLGYSHAYVNRIRAQVGVNVKFNKHHALDFYLMGDRYKDKVIDTNREGSNSWTKNGLVLRSIDWYQGYLLSAGVGYTWSF